MSPYPSAAERNDDVLLVFNCHEAWVHQLSGLGFRMDIVTGLPGRHKRMWDTQVRPIPAGSRLVPLREALETRGRYHCILAHNISDLMDVRERTEPKLVVMHMPIEARLLEERCCVPAAEMAANFHRYVELIGAHAVGASEIKARSWGLAEHLSFCAEPHAYLPWSGHAARGLRVCNFVTRRRRLLCWEFFERAFGGLPMTLVGHNPDLPGVRASRSWGELKQILAAHRFYVHTAAPDLEDGYNMAVVEAMAAGLPVLGNLNPTSPVEHGRSGFLSDDPRQLRRFAELLLRDRELAREMGAAAQRTARERFGVERFRGAAMEAIAAARRKCRTLRAGDGRRIQTLDADRLGDRHSPAARMESF